MTTSERITINPEQCGELPCIRGMRIHVRDVLEILKSCPYLVAEDIQASLQFAANQTDHPIPRCA